jgi:hypothetical protein
MAAHRQPIAVVEFAEGLMVSNRRTGTLSLVSRDATRVESEFKLARQLSDLAIVPNSDLCVAADDRANEIVLLRVTDGQPQVLQRQTVAAQPVSVHCSADGTSLTVASLWAHQVSKWTIRRDGSSARLAASGVLDVPFAPRLQCLSPDGERLVLADAFGPNLAVIHLDAFQLEAVYQIPGHNVRGLVTSPDGQELLIAHQMLNDFIPTTRDHVFWGNVLTNLLRSIAWQQLLQAPAVPASSSLTPVKVYGSLVPLGQEGRASGDPEQVAVSSRGDTLVVIAGTGELAMRRPLERRFMRLHVGARPTALRVSADGRTAWVVNRFDDQLVVVDLDSWQVRRTLSVGLGPTAEWTLADRGERLFYDASLSLDGWFSCHSCHTDGHTCGLLNDNFGDDSLGAPKRIPSLLGTADTGPWAWNGRQSTLQDQVQKSLKLTMRGSGPWAHSPEVVDALVAYLQSLTPPPPPAVARGAVDAQAVERGRQVFAARSCHECHMPPHYTSSVAYDVGLTDQRGENRFNPPSLRGLSQRSRYFHDNRIGSLEELLTIHPRSDVSTEPMSAAERDDLVTFLLSL